MLCRAQSRQHNDQRKLMIVKNADRAQVFAQFAHQEEQRNRKQKSSQALATQEFESFSYFYGFAQLCNMLCKSYFFNKVPLSLDIQSFPQLYKIIVLTVLHSLHTATIDADTWRCCCYYTQNNSYCQEGERLTA